MSITIADIERRLDADDLAGAAELAATALASGLHDPLVANLAAWRQEQAGCYEAAEQVAREAIGRWPDDPALHLALALALRGQGRLSEAVTALDAAIALDPQFGTAWFERGLIFERGGALADAADDFRRVLQIEPDHAAAQASLGVHHARAGDHAAADAHARRALAIEPGNVTARIALALVALEQRQHEEAIALLAAVKDGDGPVEAMVNVGTLLGDAYQGVGRYDDAFASYRQAQETFQAIHAAKVNADGNSATLFAERMRDALAGADPAWWRGADREGSSPDASPHVFLTGYPRSGTTLAENILASLPGAVAIEERPTLAAADRAYLREAGGLLRLASSPDAALQPLRDDYWRRASEAAGEPVDDRFFIDMDPFKGTRLPVIARLFPRAKVVLMRRDPRDVVWSCFHTSFAVNPATLAFTTLESTAHHYATTQAIVAATLERLPIDAHIVRYEELVRSFDETTEALCAFLGVAWTEQLRSFDRTAKQRGVSTASTTQVRRGLYDGSGSWRPYARQLAAVEDILAPWIERYGYR